MRWTKSLILKAQVNFIWNKNILFYLYICLLKGSVLFYTKNLKNSWDALTHYSTYTFLVRSFLQIVPSSQFSTSMLVKVHLVKLTLVRIASYVLLFHATVTYTSNHLSVIQKNNKINFCYSESITEAVKCSENGQTTDDPFQILAQISYRFATFNKVHRLGGHTIKWSMDSGERFSSEE